MRRRPCSLLAAARLPRPLVGVTGASAQAPPRVCEGLTICSPVAGPWVVVPAPVPPARVGTAVWLLGCPDGFVGGLDARVANPWVQVRFPGLMGSPVNPGITTRERHRLSRHLGRAPGTHVQLHPVHRLHPRRGRPADADRGRKHREAGAARHRPDHPHRPVGRGPAAARPRRPRLQEGAAPGRLDGLAGDLHGAPSDPAAAREGAPDDGADQGTRLDHGDPQRPRAENPGPGADPRPLHGEVPDMRSPPVPSDPSPS